ncbi:unnamed protein product [Dibothriocephalus latus]|uniref:Uncharacterized protein n=1 Tax=Dibothriocephalus latus TaxID=60516 RepID=A0A3P7LWM3_DIBLA|nr:unnamed protein product [Dibothriocephalus latus]
MFACILLNCRRSFPYILLFILLRRVVRPVDLLGPLEPEAGQQEVLLSSPGSSTRSPIKDTDAEGRTTVRGTVNDGSSETNGHVGQPTQAGAEQMQPGGPGTYRGAACLQCGQPVVGKVSKQKTNSRFYLVQTQCDAM